jgi:hypothetical protein
MRGFFAALRMTTDYVAIMTTGSSAQQLGAVAFGGCGGVGEDGLGEALF